MRQITSWILTKSSRVTRDAPSTLQSPSLQTYVQELSTNMFIIGVQNSVVDCQAQVKIIEFSAFSKYEDMVKSISTIGSIWSNKQKKKLQQEQELKVTPNSTWKVDQEAETWWAPHPNCLFTSYQGGGRPGPTEAAKNAISGCTDPIKRLAALFLFFMPMNSIIDQKIVIESNRYAI